jgi:hypothetical protein
MKRFDYAQWGAKAAAKRGEQLTHAKLTEPMVQRIKENRHGKTARQLGQEFGVHHRTIEKIRCGETWGHV